MAVLGMVLLELLEPLELLFQVANLAHVASGTSGFYLALVLLDVLVDVLHTKTGRIGPELIAAHLTAVVSPTCWLGNKHPAPPLAPSARQLAQGQPALLALANPLAQFGQLLGALLQGGVVAAG